FVAGLLLIYMGAHRFIKNSKFFAGILELSAGIALIILGLGIASFTLISGHDLYISDLVVSLPESAPAAFSGHSGVSAARYGGAEDGAIVKWSGSLLAISLTSLRVIAAPKLEKSWISRTKLPGPPITFSR